MVPGMTERAGKATDMNRREWLAEAERERGWRGTSSEESPRREGTGPLAAIAMRLAGFTRFRRPLVRSVARVAGQVAGPLR